jgi:hypothetical protein
MKSVRASHPERATSQLFSELTHHIVPAAEAVVLLAPFTLLHGVQDGAALGVAVAVQEISRTAKVLLAAGVMPSNCIDFRLAGIVEQPGAEWTTWSASRLR